MTEKQYLNQAYKIDVLIRSYKQELEELRELSTCVASVDYSREKVQSSNVSTDASFVNVVLKIAELEDVINKDINEFINLKNEIRTVIDQVKDPNEKIILRLRYVHFKSWDEICFELSKSYRTIYRLHKLALENVRIPEGGCGLC